MAATIKFVSLTSYCLVEYQMQSLSSSTVLSIPFYATKRDNIYQIYNEDSELYTTRNSKGITVMPIGGSQYVYLDIENIPNYTSYDTAVTETLLYGFSPVVDTVRIHFATGFDFSTVNALVFAVKQQLTNDDYCLLTNILFDQITSQYLLTFNPKPIFLADSQYDRYIEITIPSLKNIDNEFYTTPPTSRSTLFEYAITGGLGFILNNPITISLDECSIGTPITTDLTSYTVYNSTQHYETDIVQVNQFDDLGVVIQESEVGDYIEFFATWAGNFPDELIATLNDQTASTWIIIHQLTVFEQVGSAFIQTANVVQYQTSGFESPNKYRPILTYANEDISMSIDYTIRLLNQNTGEQIIRTGSMILLNPNKYGAHLMSLTLADAPESQHIYNKIVMKNFESTLLFIGPNNSTTAIAPTTNIGLGNTITNYIPVFYESSNIVVTQQNYVVSTTTPNDTVLFGQGKLPIVIQPFDNFIKFKVYTMTVRTGLPDLVTPMNLNLNSTLNLVFNTTGGQIVEANIQDQAKAKPGIGEILFKIAAADAVNILASSDPNFYLTVLASDGTQTAFYHGLWYSVNDQVKVDAAYQAAQSDASTIADLQSQVNTLNSTVMNLNAIQNTIQTIPSPVLSTFNTKAKLNFQTALNAKLSAVKVS